MLLWKKHGAPAIFFSRSEDQKVKHERNFSHRSAEIMNLDSFSAQPLAKTDNNHHDLSRSRIDEMSAKKKYINIHQIRNYDASMP